MASITPRASGFWADSVRTSYFPDDSGESEEQQRIMDEDYEYDGRTPLDKTIDRIGMGSYQWTLLSLCGFGWMADNMWIQAIAIILPRVQQHYSVPDSYIGTLSSSMFAGMMFGAIGWGTCSDLMGRSTAFNATLFFTSLFGIMASFSRSFFTLCILLFFLGSAVGGSMPTDGTLLLEHMPQGKQYLVTALSVFFSFGAVLSAIVAILIIPQHSCPGSSEVACNVDKDNTGWQYMLMALGAITLSMFIARMVFFRLHESPRYLVHAGRAQEALESLQMISRFNGSELSLDLEDVDDNRPPPCDAGPCDAGPFLADSPIDERQNRPDESNITKLGNEINFDANAITLIPPNEFSLPTQSSADFLRTAPSGVTDYHSTSESPNSLDGQGHSLVSPVMENVPVNLHERIVGPIVHTNSIPNAPELKDASPGVSPSSLYLPTPTLRSSRSRPRSGTGRTSVASSRGSLYKVKRKVGVALPRWIRKPLYAWLDRISMVLSPEWFKTTLLMWMVWFAMSLAYTMFNVFLPKLLESSSQGVETLKTLEASLWDVVIFTIGGCPGAILGAYLVESPMGRRGSLACSIFITALFCVVFVMVKGPLATRISTVGISLSATTMWAVLYGWTPEIFSTNVRGTACGIASALSRVGGMIAPLLGGMLLMMDRSVPVYTSVVVFIIAGICVLLLREDAGDGCREPGRRAVVH